MNDRDRLQPIHWGSLGILLMMMVLLLIGAGICSIPPEPHNPYGNAPQSAVTDDTGTDRTVQDTAEETQAITASSPSENMSEQAENSGTLATKPFTAPDFLSFRLRSDYEGTVYLRGTSYGNYNGTGFDEIQPYEEAAANSILNAMGRTLFENGAREYEMEISWRIDASAIIAPYYYKESSFPSDDIRIVGNAADYTLTFAPVSDGFPVNGVPGCNKDSAYRSYVYQNYLSLPEQTRKPLIAYLEKSKLDRSSTIDEIAAFVDQAAVYRADFAPIPMGTDVVMYFLEQTKEGICQHFAAAATLIYRALGIPARYVTGYHCETQANGEWINITPQYAHAWTEIFVDGLGWIPIEIDGAENNTDTESEGTILRILELTTQDAQKEYDGTPLTAPIYSITRGRLRQGDTLRVTMTAQRTATGSIPNRISHYVITDSAGHDVTDTYAVIIQTGSLTVTPKSITVRFLERQGYHVIRGSLIAGETVDPADTADIPLRITDNTGRDTTNNYQITYFMEPDPAAPTTLVLRSGDAEKHYDGTPLICETVDILHGSLFPGDRMEIRTVRSYSDVGIYDNTFTAVIYRTENSTDIDVTDHYAIQYQYGTLTITP